MYSFYFSDAEIEVLSNSLREREDRMLRDAETYKKQGNKVAQMDCLNEWHATQHLRERLERIKTL